MFTLKRILKDVSFVLLLAGIVIISVLAYKAGESVKTPPYGYACLAAGEDAERLCREFDSAGFIRCSSADEMYREISAAHLDCGIIVKEEFADKIKNGDLDQILTIVTSPETLLPELCRVQAVSVITAIYAPYVTFESLEGYSDIQTVKDTYNEMLAEDALFGFEIVDSSGERIDNRIRSINLFKGGLAIMIFLTIWIGCCRPAYIHACDMKKRFGFAGACRKIMLPEVLIRMLLVALAATVTCIAAGQANLIFVSLVYVLIVTVTGIPAVMILPDSWLIIITVFVMILSLGLCPIFTDLTETIPVLGTIRKVLIPYIMWEVIL